MSTTRSNSCSLSCNIGRCCFCFLMSILDLTCASVILCVSRSACFWWWVTVNRTWPVCWRTCRRHSRRLRLGTLRLLNVTFLWFSEAEAFFGGSGRELGHGELGLVCVLTASSVLVQVKCIVLQLLRGLEYLHHNFIVHRSVPDVTAHSSLSNVLNILFHCEH